jgi:hypothetical protein
MAIPTNDEIWADYKPDGSVNEPLLQNIRRKMNFIEALAAAAGVGGKPYPTKAAMDADLSQPDGKIGLVYADPVDTNNFPTLFYWNDAGNVWIKGTDRVGNIQNQASQSTTAVDGLYRSTGAPRPVAWLDSSSYEVVYPTSLTLPDTRFSASPSPAGLTIVALGAMPGVQPIGIKIKHNLLPGDSVTFRAKFTAGTLTTGSGFWIGTDPATTGPISTDARMTPYRNGGLLYALANGITADGTRDALVPNFNNLPGPALIVGTVVDYMVDVLSDRKQQIRIFQDGLQISVDTVADVTPNGSIIIGANMAANQTVFISEVTRRESPSAVLYVHSGVGSSGDGTRGAPLKSLTDIPKAMVDLGLVGKPIRIKCLTDNVYPFFQFKESLSPRWDVDGLPGGNTAFLGFNSGEVPVFTVVPGSGGQVFSTPTMLGPQLRSASNQPFILNLAWNPRPWYTMTNKALKSVPTANGGVDMVGHTDGAFANVSGQLIMRLPDGLPSPNPNDYPLPIDPLNPTGPKYAILVSRVTNVLAVTEGSPEVNFNNITLRWSSGPLFAGGAGFGKFTNCKFEWSGYNAPGVELQNGQYEFVGCEWNFTDGDCLGRAPRIDMPYQVGSTLVTRLTDCKLSRTGMQEAPLGSGFFLGGDGFSVHLFNDGTGRRHVVYMTNVHIHDTWKCGYVGSADYLMASGLLIERAGTEQFSLFADTNPSAIGRTMRNIVNGFRFDPQGVGLTGVRNIATDGMALCETVLDNGWIGTPQPLGYEIEVTGTALAGQTRDPSKNIIRYTNVTTERDAGSVARNGDGLAKGMLTFSGNPANGDTCTIGAVVYTFNTVLGGANSIKIGGSAFKTRNNLIAAIMADQLQIGENYGAGTVIHPTVTAVAAGNNMRLYAKTAGTGGNAIVTGEASTALSFGTGTLTGGAAAQGTFTPVTAHKLL